MLQSHSLLIAAIIFMSANGLSATTKPFGTPPVVPGVTIRLADGHDSNTAIGVRHSGAESGQPAGDGLWFKVLSGEMWLFTRVDGGGYWGTCGGTDWACEWTSGASSLENNVEDSDFFPQGESGECVCLLSTPVLSSTLDLLLDEQYALFTFTTDENGSCFEHPICPPGSQKLIAEGYNTLLLSTEDRSNTYTGRIHIWGRLRATSIALDDDGCDAVASHIHQEITACYSNPPAGQWLIPSDDEDCAVDPMIVAKFSGAINQLDPYNETVGEGGSRPYHDSGWVRLTPSAGICLNDDFSFGFKFGMSLAGSWVYPPVLTLELGIQVINGSTCK